MLSRIFSNSSPQEPAASIAMLHVAKLSTDGREALCVVHGLASRDATVRTSLPLQLGQSVRLTLRSGCDLDATVVASHTPKIYLMFKQAIPLPKLLAEQRRGNHTLESVRFAATGSAILYRDGQPLSCQLVDISLFGARIRLEESNVAADEALQIHIPDLLIQEATIRWKEDGDAGLSFRHSLGYNQLERWLDIQHDRAVMRRQQVR